jgi:Xaa-Pro aminopeptidase
MSHGIEFAVLSSDDGRYYLGYVPHEITTRGDLGRGCNPTQIVFMTEEGRRYFINFEYEREAHAHTAEKIGQWERRFSFLFGHDESPSAERLAEYSTKTNSLAEALGMIDADIQAAEAAKWEDCDE